MLPSLARSVPADAQLFFFDLLPALPPTPRPPRLGFEADPPPGRFDFGSFATTRSYEVFISSVSSRRSSVSPSSSSITHMLRAMYGAGMMPGRSTSSANDSGVHLN